MMEVLIDVILGIFAVALGWWIGTRDGITKGRRMAFKDIVEAIEHHEEKQKSKK